PFVRQQRENFLIILNRFVARRFGHLSPRKELLWHDYMRDMRPVGSRKKQLSIPREIKPARIAFESRDHFKRAAVRLKSENPAANVREAFAFLILHLVASALSLRGINPAIHAPTQIVNQRRRIGVCETAEEHLPLINRTVMVRIAQPNDLGSVTRDHAVAIKNKTRQIAQPLTKNMLLIHAAFALSVLQNHQAIAAIRAAACAGECEPRSASGIPINVNRPRD